MPQALHVLFKSWARLLYFSGTQDSQGFLLSAKVLLEVRHNECYLSVQHCAQCCKDINISLVKTSLLGSDEKFHT